MSNFITKHRRWKMTTAILSLSLLTVMAGAVRGAIGGLFPSFSSYMVGMLAAVILGIWSVLMKSE